MRNDKKDYYTAPMITPDNHDMQRGKSWFDETGPALKFSTGAITGLVFALISLFSLLSGDNSFWLFGLLALPCSLTGLIAVVTGGATISGIGMKLAVIAIILTILVIAIILTILATCMMS